MLDATVAGPNPVLVDFSAAWCGPCRAMAPALEAFAAHRTDGLAVVKVDIDAAPGIVSRVGPVVEQDPNRPQIKLDR